MLFITVSQPASPWVHIVLIAFLDSGAGGEVVLAFSDRCATIGQKNIVAPRS